MDSNKDRRFMLLKKCCIVFVLFLSIILLITDIEKSEIITLSATSNPEPQAIPADDSLEQSPVINKPAPVVQQKQMNPSVNAVAEAAVKLGVLSSVSRINQISSFLSANNQTGVFIFKPQNQPDQHIFSTSFELIRNDDSTIYASASFFPNQDAVYDTVEYVEKSCEEVEKNVFSNLKRISVVKKNVIVLDGGAVKVFLMPAGSGTIVIKKEVVQ